MPRNRDFPADRGQAYTLEGFIGAIVVLTAVLFVLQSIVLTPTAGGSVDRTAQAQLEQEVQDVLVVAENEGKLTEIATDWEEDDFDGTTSGNDTVYDHEGFAAEYDFGELLNDHFVNGSGNSYNVDLVTYDGNDGVTLNLVRMGGPSDSAVSASYTVAVVNGTDDYTIVEVRVTVW